MNEIDERYIVLKILRDFEGPATGLDCGPYFSPGAALKHLCGDGHFVVRGLAAAVHADPDHRSLDVEPECLSDRVQILDLVGDIARGLTSNFAVLHGRLARAFYFHAASPATGRDVRTGEQVAELAVLDGSSRLKALG
jgi:hypothetical protein